MDTFREEGRSVMKTAIVHDYFVQMGGAERVAEEMYRMEPSATVFATVALDDWLPGLLRDAEVRTSWMQWLPGIRSLYRLYFLLYPLRARPEPDGVRVHPVELVRLCERRAHSTPCRAHLLLPHADALGLELRQVLGARGYGTPAALGDREGGARAAVLGPVRAASAGPLHRELARRGRAHPALLRTARRGDLSADRHGMFHALAHAGRLLPGAFAAGAVQARGPGGTGVRAAGAAARRGGFGSGSGLVEGARRDSVTFTGRISDEEVNRLAEQCKALLFPGEEDFGTAPLEVAAAGRPTIAYAAGGALETVVDGVPGLFFNEPTADSLAEAILRFEQGTWRQGALRAHAESFGIQVFQERCSRSCARHYAAGQQAAT